ncbi:class I SAM-dependent methyltransferase [Roseibacillus persicicus]|uniref:class I SAM-dependent methyltransferase n=1 Tax=Roseibacillus persicicus TaxID=454148 RepID=UPI00280F855C|nr:class I SAM-dependent methyltransferase [Roseibacillus persicicus]MDQ8189374.1 class I SAM-dependent methyltransferase [Roseibacillus persicicus]
MNRSLALLVVLLVVAVLGGFFLLKEKPPTGQAPPAPTPTVPRPESYTTGPASRDGIGKFYLGREIAHVMGHQAINWLERDNREAEEAPSAAISALEIQPDDVIADIGAGSGYYTFRLAPLVPRGRVIAIDIQPEMIEFLTNRARGEGVKNVQPHLSTITSLELPPESLDSAILVDVYHEFSHPVEMLASLYSALKPGGRLFLLEYRGEDPEVPIKPLHKMTETQAIKEMKASGLEHVKTLHHLPWQHLMIFEK